MYILVGVANGKTNLAHSLAIPSASKSSYNSEAALKCEAIFLLNLFFNSSGRSGIEFCLFLKSCLLKSGKGIFLIENYLHISVKILGT